MSIIPTLFPLSSDDGKICKQCHEWKPFIKFVKGGYVGGRSPRCTKCTIPKEARQRYDKTKYERHKEEIKARAKKYAELNPDRVRELAHRNYHKNKEYRQAWQRRYVKDNAAKVKAAKRKYAKEHAEHYAAYHQRYGEQNKERLQEQRRVYYEANKEIITRKNKEYRKRRPEVKQISELNRERRIKEAGGKFTTAEWTALCERYGNICLCCKREVKLTVDHVIPVSKGGRNDIENIQPLCLTCNVRKNTKVIDYR